MLQGLMVGVCRVMKLLAVGFSGRVACDQKLLKSRQAMSAKPFVCTLLLLFAVSPVFAAEAGKSSSKLVKIANDGGELPEAAALGTNAKDWACTLDRTTGLVWEVKTTSGLRSQTNSYSWYSSDTAGSAIGTQSGGFCFKDGRCDTEKYIADVNSMGLCGARDWRMPQAKELEAHFAIRLSTPDVYAAFFPNTSSTYYWSGTPGAFYSFSAWAVYVSNAQAYYFHRTGSNGIRAVRKAQ